MAAFRLLPPIAVLLTPAPKKANLLGNDIDHLLCLERFGGWSDGFNRR
jgi:hypothetical protein